MRPTGTRNDAQVPELSPLCPRRLPVCERRKSERTMVNGEFVMTGRLKLLASSLLAAGALWCGSANATPISAHGIAADAGTIRVQPVQWHGHGHHGWNRGGRWNRGGWGWRGPGFSVGIGAPYAYGAYGTYYDGYNGYAAVPLGQSRTDQDEAYCEQRFRSYDSESGTYLGYDGRRHPCP
jgi:BA14K-like protein